VLIIVQNLSVPLDRRVWQECKALVAEGVGVSVICPKGPGEASYEELEGVNIYRYLPPPAAKGLAGYAGEFIYCWVRTALLSLKVHRRDGFDAIQACNPPDTYWALALPWKAAGKRFVFDHHDLNPEVYASRFGRTEGLLYKGLLALERATFKVADQVISTNESYKAVAVRRGGRKPEDVTVVRSGPDARSRTCRARPRPASGRRAPGEYGAPCHGVCPAGKRSGSPPRADSGHVGRSAGTASARGEPITHLPVRVVHGRRVDVEAPGGPGAPSCGVSPASRCSTSPSRPTRPTWPGPPGRRRVRRTRPRRTAARRAVAG